MILAALDSLGSSSDPVLSLSLLVADGETGLSDTSCSVMETLEGQDVVATLAVVGTDDCPCKMSILMAGMPPLAMADGGLCEMSISAGEGVLSLSPSSPGLEDEEEGIDGCSWKIVAVILALL